MSGASIAGESIQAIVRDQWIGELHRLNVETVTFARFFGAEDRTAFFQHMTNGEPIICEDVDTIVSCFARQSNRDFDWLFDASSTNGIDAQVVKSAGYEEPIIIKKLFELFENDFGLVAESDYAY